MTDQKSMLLTQLQSQRRHLLKTIDGLDEETMRTLVLPSRWSPAGLIHHLIHDVERFWFRQVLLNEPKAILTTSGEEAWDVPAGMSAAEIVDEYISETTYNDAVVQKLSLNTTPAWWDHDLFGHGPPQDMSEILLHVMTETAMHAGHMGSCMTVSSTWCSRTRLDRGDDHPLRGRSYVRVGGYLTFRQYGSGEVAS